MRSTPCSASGVRENRHLEEHSAQTIVIGVGNLLMADEGIGVRVVQRLVEQYHIPEGVQILDGGTLGLDLLYYLEGCENLLLIDAVSSELEPGGLLCLRDEEVPAFLSMKISPHQIGIPDMLAAAHLKGIYPQRVVLWGIQPGLVEIGLTLSPEVSEQLDVLVSKVLEQLDAWGQKVSPRIQTLDAF